MLGLGGTLIIVGMTDEKSTITINSLSVPRNERVIIGSWYGSKKSKLSLGDSFHRSRINLITSQVSTIDPKFSGRWTKERRFSVAWEMLRAIKPSRLVTHEYPIEEAKVAYDNLHQNSDDILQVILKYDT